MYGFDSMAKMVVALVESHPNPTGAIQDLLKKSTDQREQEEIKAIAWCWGIKLDEKVK